MRASFFFSVVWVFCFGSKRSERAVFFLVSGVLGLGSCEFRLFEWEREEGFFPSPHVLPGGERRRGRMN